ncbi:MAG: NAD(P)/FAD-dependent oxidoreductase [Lachnospiraceae bacterium]|nr:NAD(P)/FAD-dependent oxidoreductase [Lachnospiraceae bacterium]
MRYDCIIIGSGPAGLSAAINLKTYEKNFLWFGSANLSEKVEKAECVNNYPGLCGVTGKELQSAFLEHKEKLGLEITDKIVSNVYDMGGYYMVVAENEFFETNTILFATGVVLANQYKGESEFVGCGVSYCATCDGGLYRGKTIAIIATSKRFEHEITFLAGLAEKVYLFPFYKGYENTFEGMTVNAKESSGSKSENVLEENDEKKKAEFQNIEIVKVAPKEVKGDMRVTSLLLGDGTELSLDGIFIMRNAIAPTTILNGLEMEDGHIKVNRKMETNLKGVFAAGDCTGKPYQYAKAVGEGNVAAHSIVEQ